MSGAGANRNRKSKGSKGEVFLNPETEQLK